MTRGGRTLATQNCTGLISCKATSHRFECEARKAAPSSLIPGGKRPARIGSSHVVWAYDSIIWAYKREGNSLSKIRDRLRDEHSLHVGTEAIRAVIESGEPR